MTETEFVVHPEPAWGDRADFVINAELEESDLPRRFEQLRVRQIGDSQFEICCIPFFLYDVSLGDVVETEPSGGRTYMMKSVTRRSGHYTFRVWFGASFQPRDEVVDQLQTLGAVVEWSSVNLLAVDAVDLDHAQKIADYLHGEQELGNLMYETGRSA